MILMIIIEIVFWLSVFAVFHSYILFPLILKVLSLKKRQNTIIYSKNDKLPVVSVLLSVHNEEEVIGQKIRSTYQTTYPLQNIELLIGSDNSTDATNEIIQKLCAEFSSVRFYDFKARLGKANIMNELVEKATGELFIFTDAKVFFKPDTIYQLIKHFKNSKTGIVGGNLINQDYDKQGVVIQENAYMEREILMKYREGILWQTTIGVFGACFAIKPCYYKKVPSNFLVDDFYITMRVLEQKAGSIMELQALCTENLASSIQEEFRRKVRIATGNFQNLKTFYKLLFPLNSGLSFSFLSHKVIRWTGPFLIIVSFIANIFLIKNDLYQYIFLLYCFTLCIPFFDAVLRKIGIHCIVLRFITHFYSTNLAILIGFIKFLKGVKTNVWQPSKRKYTV